MNGSVSQLSVALAIIFFLNVVSCSNHDNLIKKAIDDEAKKLAQDEAVFKEIRVRYIVDMIICMDRRSRRAAYKLFRDLELKREEAINEILHNREEIKSVKMLYTKLRKAHNDARKMVKKIKKMMLVACSSSESEASEVVTMLNSYLEDRMPSADVQENIDRIGEPVDYCEELTSEKDFWDESAVLLESDILGAKAVTYAVRFEREALKDDQEQLEKMGRHMYCEGVDKTVFKDWARTRKAAIEEVLSREFAYPIEFRRELGKVHKKHLELLPKLDRKLKNVCEPDCDTDMIHWMDVWFFERYTAAIRGENWLAYKKNGEQSSDFENLLSDRDSI